MRLSAVVTLSMCVHSLVGTSCSRARTGCEGRSWFIALRCTAQWLSPTIFRVGRGQHPQPQAPSRAQPSPPSLQLFAPPSKVLPGRLQEQS